jgi:TonB family protein
VTTARSERAVPDLVLPDVTLPDVATTLVAGVLSAAPDLERSLSRPEDFTRLAPQDGDVGLDAPLGALALTAARASTVVDLLPVPLVNNPRPAYPLALERARVDGRVVVEFRIDSVGAVDPASLRIVTSTDARFTDAVRGVLPRLRFVPAQLREHAVGVTVRQPFVFRVGRRP